MMFPAPDAVGHALVRAAHPERLVVACKHADVAVRQLGPAAADAVDGREDGLPLVCLAVPSLGEGVHEGVDPGRWQEWWMAVSRGWEGTAQCLPARLGASRERHARWQLPLA